MRHNACLFALIEPSPRPNHVESDRRDARHWAESYNGRVPSPAGDIAGTGRPAFASRARARMMRAREEAGSSTVFSGPEPGLARARGLGGRASYSGGDLRTSLIGELGVRHAGRSNGTDFGHGPH